jgi:nucleotide sugar dehydrogenase
MRAAVIGIGKLGLCFALSVEKTGAHVIGVDISEDYIQKINSKTLCTTEPGLKEALERASRFTSTTDLSFAVKNSDYIFILVQTPETIHSYDHTILEKVIHDITTLETEPKHIIVNSTVIPGFHSKQNVGCHTLSYNPAFVAQGTVMADYSNGGKFNVVVVGTENDEVKQVLGAMYKIMNPSVNIQFMTPASAEVFKLANNTFRVLKIVYANLISDIVKKTNGAVVNEVAEALKKDSSIGSICMTPGYGYGGPCYPRDLTALTNYAKDLGVCEGLLSGAKDCNEDHHSTLLKEFLHQNLEEYIFEDVSYRPGMKVKMFDNSPSLRLAKDLESLGKKVIIQML